MKNQQLQTLLTEAQMSPVMVAEQINVMVDESAPALAALDAVARAERSHTPLNNKLATDAAVAWMDSNPDYAAKIINTRIAVRNARSARA